MVSFVRFDDRLLTILGYPTSDVGAKAAVWTQIVDILAQDREHLSSAMRESALATLTKLRPDVPDHRRLASSVSIAGRQLSADIVALFASDAPMIAAPIITRAPLSDSDWLSLIPGLPTASRALLRERRDLTPSVERALATYGTSDFILSDEHVEADQPSAKPLTDVTTPIGELVKRIEAYRGRDGLTPTPIHRDGPHLQSFAFETDASGIIIWVEGAPRGPIIGISLSEMAEPGGYGVDGQAMGAFRKRASFRSARLAIAGTGPAAGDWALAAQPFFDPSTGRFEGYCGVSRRQSTSDADGPNSLWSGLHPDSTRQLVHELRTPLNAIRGFAEMIEGQFLGPVEPPYRHRAGSIMLDAERLLRLFEDLDMSARLVGEEGVQTLSSQADVTRILRAVATHHARIISARRVKMQIVLPDPPAIAILDETTAVRLIDRLILAILCSAEDGETVQFALSESDSGVRIEASLPIGLQNISAHTLMDPTRDTGLAAFSEELPLGLAFILRLLRQMARRVGWRFELGTDSFVLILPRRADTAGESKESV